MRAQYISQQNNFNEDFDRIYYEYHRQVFAYAFRWTQSKYDAEEIMQLTFIKLWKNFDRLSEDIALEKQIFRIAKTSLIDYLRKNEKSKYAIKSIDNNIDLFQKQSAENQKILEYKETYNKLEKLIATFPPARKQVFELSRLHGLSYKEISEQLNISTKTVENHINLALRYLKALFV